MTKFVRSWERFSERYKIADEKMVNELVDYCEENTGEYVATIIDEAKREIQGSNLRESWWPKVRAGLLKNFKSDDSEQQRNTVTLLRSLSSDKPYRMKAEEVERYIRTYQQNVGQASGCTRCRLVPRIHMILLPGLRSRRFPLVQSFLRPDHPGPPCPTSATPRSTSAPMPFSLVHSWSLLLLDFRHAGLILIQRVANSCFYSGSPRSLFPSGSGLLLNCFCCSITSVWSPAEPSRFASCSLWSRSGVHLHYFCCSTILAWSGADRSPSLLSRILVLMCIISVVLPSRPGLVPNLPVRSPSLLGRVLVRV